jgi:hypothetical protein
MVVNMARFGNPDRTNLNQLAVREALYEALPLAFAERGIGWDSCVSEDQGDGAIILIPPEVPKTRLVTSLPGVLAAVVGRRNAGGSVLERMRLRVARTQERPTATHTALSAPQPPGYEQNFWNGPWQLLITMVYGTNCWPASP